MANTTRYILSCVWKNGTTSQLSEALEAETEVIKLLLDQDETVEHDDLQPFRWNSSSPNVDYYLINKA